MNMCVSYLDPLFFKVPFKFASKIGFWQLLSHSQKQCWFLISVNQRKKLYTVPSDVSTNRCLLKDRLALGIAEPGAKLKTVRLELSHKISQSINGSYLGNLVRIFCMTDIFAACWASCCVEYLQWSAVPIFSFGQLAETSSASSMRVKVTMACHSFALTVICRLVGEIGRVVCWRARHGKTPRLVRLIQSHTRPTNSQPRGATDWFVARTPAWDLLNKARKNIAVAMHDSRMQWMQDACATKTWELAQTCRSTRLAHPFCSGSEAPRNECEKAESQHNRVLLNKKESMQNLAESLHHHNAYTSPFISFQSTWL